MAEYQVIHYDKVESTNTLIKENLTQYQDHTLLKADYQSKGRGRRDNAWMSEKGSNFLGTFYKITEKRPSFRFLLEASVALVKTLEFYGIKPNIKPPNDIYVSDKKIAGILIEVIHRAKLHVLSGIGLNVNDSGFETWIAMETIKTHPLNLNEVSTVLKRAFEKAEEQTHQDLFGIYKSHIDFDKIKVESQGSLVPLLDITEAFECKVGSVYQACESLSFTYKN